MKKSKEWMKVKKKGRKINWQGHVERKKKKERKKERKTEWNGRMGKKAYIRISSVKCRKDKSNWINWKFAIFQKIYL